MKAQIVKSSDPQTGFGSRADAVSVVLLLTVSALVIRLPFLGDANADIDEQLYSLIGNAMLDGKLPFVDLWDRNARSSACGRCGASTGAIGRLSASPGWAPPLPLSGCCPPRW